MGQQINTAAYDPKVAAQTALQTGASQAAQGLGSLVGPDAYQPFMSPYQQEVMDTTLAEFDRQQAINQTGLRDQAIGAGIFFLTMCCLFCVHRKYKKLTICSYRVL